METKKRIMVLTVLACGMLGFATAHADQVALPFDIADGLENMWSVQKDGSLTGPPPIYGGNFPAGQLTIDGSRFPEAESATRMVYEGGTEIQIGPKVIGPVHVTRKLHFRKGEGHIRFIEVIENRSTTPVTVKASLFSNPNESTIVWENENSVVASGAKAVVAAFYYGTGGALKPTRDKKSSSISYWWDAVAIQPESKVVLLHFSVSAPNVSRHSNLLRRSRSLPRVPTLKLAIYPVSVTMTLEPSGQRPESRYSEAGTKMHFS